MPILTIDSARLNGTPSTGTVRITASRSPLMDSGNNTVYSGTQTFPLDAQGKLSVSLPATDSPSIGPFTYTVEANLASGQWIYRGVKLPANVATIDITDAQSASQQTYPTRQEWDAIMAGMNTTIEGKVTGPGMGLRRDITVGERVILDHPGGTTMLMGDTGWRNISQSLENGWTGTVLIRRQNATIDCLFHDVRSDEATSGTVLTFPPGFRSSGLPTGVPARPVLNDVSVPPNFYRGLLSTSLQVYGWESEAIRLYSSIMYTTTNSWPASLPGTPA